MIYDTAFVDKKVFFLLFGRVVGMCVHTSENSRQKGKGRRCGGLLHPGWKRTGTEGTSILIPLCSRKQAWFFRLLTLRSVFAL